jgi:hypothetical protein
LHMLIQEIQCVHVFYEPLISSSRALNCLSSVSFIFICFWSYQ